MSGKSKSETVASFEQIERDPSLTERVHKSIMESIVTGKLSIGDQLPSERELCESFGVSRTVVREAIRGLQAKGVLRFRPGKSVEVVAVPGSHVAEAINLFIQGSSEDGLSPEKIGEVREILEVRMVELACQRATAEEIKDIQRAHELMMSTEDVTLAAQYDVSFHRHLAAATHNPLFVVLIDSLAEVMMEVRRRSMPVPGRKKAAFAEHAKILEALLSGDVVAAKKAMNEHLNIAQATLYTETKSKSKK